MQNENDYQLDLNGLPDQPSVCQTDYGSYLPAPEEIERVKQELKAAHLKKLRLSHGRSTPVYEPRIVKMFPNRGKV